MSLLPTRPPTEHAVRTVVKIPSDPRKCSRAAPSLRATSRAKCAASSRRDGPTCEREDFRRCGMAARRPVHLGGRMRKQKPETWLTASGPCRRDRRNPSREQRRTARRRCRVPWRLHDAQMRLGQWSPADRRGSTRSGSIQAVTAAHSTPKGKYPAKPTSGISHIWKRWTHGTA